MPMTSFTTIYQPTDQLSIHVEASLIKGDPHRRYVVYLPGNLSIHGTKPQLNEVLRAALAALHADDEPATDPELVPGELVAVRIHPDEMGRVLDHDEVVDIGFAAIDALPRGAA